MQIIFMRMDPLVIYVIVRKDLQLKFHWPLGALMNQALHAVSGAVWTMRNDPKMTEYMSEMAIMRKVTLEAKNENHMRNLINALHSKQISVFEWIEQPENLLTAIATMPCRKSEVGDVFKKYQLFHYK